MILSSLLAAALSCAAAVPAAPAPEPAAPFALRDGDRVVFYGDSITQDGAYARFVEEYVRTRFPRWNVRFYNAGVGGDTVRGGGAGPIDVRLERDVIALKPTVVTIMLGMNDGGYKPSTRRRFDTFARRLPARSSSGSARAARRAAHAHPALAVRRRGAAAAVRSRLRRHAAPARLLRRRPSPPARRRTSPTSARASTPASPRS